MLVYQLHAERGRESNVDMIHMLDASPRCRNLAKLLVVGLEEVGGSVGCLAAVVVAATALAARSGTNCCCCYNCRCKTCCRRLSLDGWA